MKKFSKAKTKWIIDQYKKIEALGKEDWINDQHKKVEAIGKEKKQKEIKK